ncbi:uncharacterized protein LOC111243807 [Varroa destructor]|uniref:Uncharacterized protein n=1 Tax=Varroa destructor TaxID=109461 RepID=A0A7M7M3K3_VARDE|nr:uncharacterized protein LOC111243807 [Varroa destructor]
MRAFIVLTVVYIAASQAQNEQAQSPVCVRDTFLAAIQNVSASFDQDLQKVPNNQESQYIRAMMERTFNLISERANRTSTVLVGCGANFSCYATVLKNMNRDASGDAQRTQKAVLLSAEKLGCDTRDLVHYNYQKLYRALRSAVKTAAGCFF